VSPNELAANGTTGLPGTSQPSWKRELNDKIAAARARRQAGQPVVDRSSREPADTNSRASRVAAAVAARYADAPSYSEYLASEVRAALMAAVHTQQAANESRAAAVANPIDTPADPAPQARTPKALPVPADQVPSPAPAKPAKSRSVPSRAIPAAARVDHAASGFPYAPHVPAAQAAGAPTGQHGYTPTAPDLSDPVQDALVTPATPLPAKLLEFPRELIAARKARPRHAEGPLRDGDTSEPGQLRIFEVDPSTISTQPEAVPQATEWSSIRLDAYPADYPVRSSEDHTAVTAVRSHAGHNPTYNRDSPYNQGVAHAQSHLRTRPANDLRSQAFQSETLPHVAGLSDRLMAGIVDAALVGIAFVLFVFVFTASTAHPPAGRAALIGGAVVLVALYLLYHLLFFTYADCTPGMRYARIALCTFDDDNPSREAMRKRIFALVLAAAPLGLGFLYAFFDEEHLGWHDRMTRMYQRSYK
jgi:uncharacterized RDD family membrane protein YckC